MIHSTIGDSCIGFITTPWLITENEKNFVLGKYYMESGVAKIIWDNFPTLINTIVNLRLTTGCNNSDPQTVCKTCQGWTHIAIPPNTNLGHAITLEQTNPLTSVVLGTKHLQKSTKSIDLHLDKAGKYWFEIKDGGKYLYINSKIINYKSIRMYLSTDYVKLLNHIAYANPRDLVPSSISECFSVDIVTVDKHGKENGLPDEVNLEIGKLGLYLTNDMLVYLKKYSWKNHGTYIEISLDHWDNKLPVFAIPSVTRDIGKILYEFVNFIKYSKNDKLHISGYSTVPCAINALRDILGSDVPTSMILLEIFVKAAMCKDKSNNDYSMPLATDDITFVGYADKLKYASLSGMLAHERQTTRLQDIYWESPDAKLMDHILDGVFLGR
jgi:hypothetical protein